MGTSMSCMGVSMRESAGNDAVVQHPMAMQQCFGERTALAAQGIVEFSPVSGRQEVACYRQHVVLLHLHVAEVESREVVHQGLEVVAAAVADQMPRGEAALQ